MLNDSKYMINITENSLGKYFIHTTVPEKCNDDGGGTCDGILNQVLVDNFIFSHMYNSTMHVDLNAQSNIRIAGFNVIDDKHLELYKERIRNKYLLYYDKYEKLAMFPSVVLPSENGCCHNYVKELEQVVSCIKQLELSFDANERGNILIFYPYLKQLCVTIDMLKKSFKCCTNLLNNLGVYINNIITNCLLYIEKVKAINKSIQVINVFVDDSAIYECNICKEISTDERFLKPKECCEFVMCNSCCVQLWKMANTHAKCPACNTSFKSIKIK
ncbi:IE-0 [Lonomia obliqua multiple nucleopolyhedrovirus]|uniref:IE-0 n=1 Tax=Lonomia obliqua multiple nucleopolyhedrovirus TaxID=134394 RepID=A0A126FC27_9ABAC|nr:IE-0 [Lonomia obliqua multiple nucleopolyhedrovirus]AKN80951.1 IE-0 [Lonomia obliqua multiple nucleopolyhedrovirus]